MVVHTLNPSTQKQGLTIGIVKTCNHTVCNILQTYGFWQRSTNIFEMLEQYPEDKRNV